MIEWYIIIMPLNTLTSFAFHYSLSLVIQPYGLELQIA